MSEIRNRTFAPNVASLDFALRFTPDAEIYVTADVAKDFADRAAAAAFIRGVAEGRLKGADELFKLFAAALIGAVAAAYLLRLVAP